MCYFMQTVSLMTLSDQQKPIITCESAQYKKIIIIIIFIIIIIPWELGFSRFENSNNNNSSSEIKLLGLKFAHMPPGRKIT